MGALAAVGIGAIGAGVAGAVNASSSDAERQAQLAAYAHLPAPPNYQHLFDAGWNAQNAETPNQVYQDFKLRSQYAPAEQKQALQLFQQYGPQYDAENLRLLQQVDPQFLAGYRQLGSDLSSDLALGSQLTPQQLALDNADIAGNQAARGNVLGNAPVAAASLFDANAQQAMYQQRLQNLQSYLAGPNPQGQFAALGAGAGQAALTQGTAALTNPQMQYYQLPQNWGPQYVQNASLRWTQQNQDALAQAQAAYSAVPQVNPWLASMAAGSGALAGGLSGTGGGSSGAGNLGSLFGGGGLNSYSIPSAGPSSLSTNTLTQGPYAGAFLS
jgi:hypothetical protein